MKRMMMLWLTIPLIGLAARGDDVLRFPTEKELINHYVDAIQQAKPKTAEKLMDILVPPSGDKKEGMEKVRPLLVMLDIALEQAGAFRRAEAAKTLKVGTWIRRVLYLIHYEHNVVFIDTWVVNSTKGWQVTHFDWKANTDSWETLKAIPEVFYSAP